MDPRTTPSPNLAILEFAMPRSTVSHKALQDNDLPSHRYDAIIIGAGIAGMYQLHCLRKLGLSIRVFETGSDVGGTWYWNRYPGARFDSESYTYGYSFSEELLQEWSWSEHFASQPETLRYLNLVADKFDLRRDIQFNTRVVSAAFDAEQAAWVVELEDGSYANAQFLITAVGVLSAPTKPSYSGMDIFKGPSFHTAHWPHEPVSFEGKRIGVIGTGASGVQAIQEIAKTARHLTVFQRTPNYCAPLHNAPIDAATQKEIKASYPQIFKTCSETIGGFIHKADPRFALDVPEAEREAFYEKLYNAPGFGIWLGNFRDIVVSQAANDTISDFIKRKIRQRVKDPLVAEKLVPKNHGFGTRRVPLETNYYEVYNQDNVELVDISATPITQITETGIQTTASHYDFDIIIYATGFDAITGSFDRIDIRGQDGQLLRDKWLDGPRTYLGIQINGFPNLFTLVGPHNAATFCNLPRCIEQNVEWVTAIIDHMRRRNYRLAEADADAEDQWTKEVNEFVTKTLLTTADSWFMGINKNVPGKSKRTFLAYAAGAVTYRQKCEEVVAAGYRGISFR